jgi:hypothetical protein
MIAGPTAAALTLAPSKCWTRVGPGTMPPADLTVIVWNATSREPCAVFFDPEMQCWILRSDPTTIHEGAITHWRQCHAPDADSEEPQSMSIETSKPATKEAAPAITRDSMRILGEQAGEHALKDLEGCVDPAIAFEGWRDYCYAELAEQLAGHVDLPDLLAVWSRARDSVQPLGLSAKESALLEAYRLSDDRGRDTLSEAAERMADDWPRYTLAFASDQVDQSCVPDLGVSFGVDAVLAAFNAMDERRQKESLHFLETLAKEFPA